MNARRLAVVAAVAVATSRKIRPVLRFVGVNDPGHLAGKRSDSSAIAEELAIIHVRSASIRNSNVDHAYRSIAVVGGWASVACDGDAISCSTFRSLYPHAPPL